VEFPLLGEMCWNFFLHGTWKCSISSKANTHLLTEYNIILTFLTFLMLRGQGFWPQVTLHLHWILTLGL
jgi:hypothetical protein